MERKEKEQQIRHALLDRAAKFKHASWIHFGWDSSELPNMRRVNYSPEGFLKFWWYIDVDSHDPINDYDILWHLLGLETRALEEEVKRLRDGIVRINRDSVNMTVWDDLEALIATFPTS